MTLSQIIRSARKAKGLTTAELAEKVGFSRAYFSLLERGLRRLDDEAIVSVALVLDLDPGELLLAGLRERLPENLRGYVPDDLERHRSNPEARRTIAREFHAENLEFEIEREEARWKSDWDGNVDLAQTIHGCRPSFAKRPVFELAFRQWSIGDETLSKAAPPEFDVRRSPPKLEYRLKTVLQGNTLHRVITFPKGWRRAAHKKQDSFGFTLRSHHPQALYLDAAAFLEQAAKDGLRGPLRGCANIYVRHLVRRIEASLELPDGYEPLNWKPIVWWGAGPLLSATRDVGQAASRSLTLSADRNRASLVVEEPMPGFTFSITWTPLDTHEYLAARHGGVD